MNSTRRTFLIGSMLGLSGSGYWSSQAESAPKSANEQVKLGVIGVANHGLSNLLKFQDQQITALCDVDSNALDGASKIHPKATRYRDYRKLIEKESIDALLISSPDHTHALAAALAMKKGIHVYCEKPLAHTIEECQYLEQLATETKVVTQTSFQHHNTRGYRRLREIVQSGALGKIKDVHCWSAAPIWPKDLTEHPATVPVPKWLDWDLWLGSATDRPYHEDYHPFLWRAWWDFGSGVIGDYGCHLLDPVVSALQLGMPDTVSASCCSHAKVMAPNWSEVKFQYNSASAIGKHENSCTLHWYDGGKTPSPEIVGMKKLPPYGILIIGEQATLYASKKGAMPVIISSTKTSNFRQPETKLESDINHYQEWITAIQQQTETSCPFSYGSFLTSTCLLGTIALRTGRKVNWNHDQRSISDDAENAALLTKEYRKGWELPA